MKKRVRIRASNNTRLYVGRIPVVEDNYVTHVTAVKEKRIKWLPKLFINKKEKLVTLIKLTDDVIENLMKYPQNNYFLTIRTYIPGTESVLNLKPFKSEKEIKAKLNLD